MRSFVRPFGRRLTLAVVGAVTGLGLAASLAFSGAALASIPKHATWKSSAKFGAWNNHGFIVYNNEWNTSVAGPQTIWAYNFHHFGVESNQSRTTEVKTYPCVQKNYNNVRYTRFKGLVSTFTESMPHARNFDAEAAYDLWLNNYKIEVMMWFDNHRQRPAGNIIKRINIFGKRFAVWKSGNSLFSFALLGKQERRGRAHLLSALRWLVRHHYLSRSVRVTQVNFGWEIAYTSSRARDFTLTRYSLKTGLR